MQFTKTIQKFYLANNASVMKGNSVDIVKRLIFHNEDHFIIQLSPIDLYINYLERYVTDDFSEKLSNQECKFNWNPFIRIFLKRPIFQRWGHLITELSPIVL